MLSKQCGRCKQTKSLSDFHKSSSSKDGLQRYCATCIKDYKDKSKLKEKVVVSEKLCKNCKQVKPADKFFKSSTSKDGRRPWCSSCVHNYMKSLDFPRQETGTKFCQNCNQDLDVSLFWSNQCNRTGLSSYCINCQTINSKNRRDEIKHIVISHYGGACICCGESKIGFLTIDHSNEDGKVDRAVIGGGTRFYRWLLKNNFPDDKGYRVMCFNCNCGRAANGGVCPHEN